MHMPTADELAAIAAAYVAVTASAGMTADGDSASPTEKSRWRLAGRLPDCDDQSVRFGARSASRWNAAGRVDG